MPANFDLRLDDYAPTRGAVYIKYKTGQTATFAVFARQLPAEGNFRMARLDGGDRAAESRNVRLLDAPGFSLFKR
ncbi:MAG: hypothetical protein NC924_10175 [Candidatus Omnitrophica bacterium]|nr:hypothetical protein [Candidatus Omnitrophota bacterium]